MKGKKKENALGILRKCWGEIKIGKWGDIEIEGVKERDFKNAIARVVERNRMNGREQDQEHNKARARERERASEQGEGGREGEREKGREQERER